MKQIQLSKTGKYAGQYTVLVDDKDYDLLNQWKWNAVTSNGKLFYAARTVYLGKYKYKTIIMHRFIMSAIQETEVDHIDHNGLNNQRSNLRFCNRYENCRNGSKKSNRTSDFLGVSKKTRHYKDKIYEAFIAQIHFNKKIHLGFFPFTKEGEIAAAKCYDSAALKYYGEFANVNFK